MTVDDQLPTEIRPEGPRNPFVGPRPLGADDELYGRTREVRDIQGLLLSHRIVLLYSPSGAGKSSLIEAILRKRMTDKGVTVPSTIRVGRSIVDTGEDAADGDKTFSERGLNAYTAGVIASLEAWCESDEGPPGLRGLEPSDDLAVWLSRIVEASPNERLCLFLDQFEELFTLDAADYDEKRAFLVELGTALSDHRVRALFSMREDHIAQLDPYLGLIPTGLQTRFRLGLLGPVGALAAIQGPNKVVDAPVIFQDDAAVKLVHDLRTVKVERGGRPIDGLGPGVEPLQLQLVCSRLWRDRLDVGRITADDIDVGGVDQALEKYYDEQINAVVADDQADVADVDLRRWFEQKLITHDGYRDLVRGTDTPGNADAVLKRLEGAHLIRGDSGRGPTRYELTHDRFVEPIRASNRAFEEKRAENRRKRMRNTAVLAVALVLVVATVAVALVSANRSSRATQLSAVSVEIPSSQTVTFDAAGKERFRLDPGVGDVVEATLTSGIKAELTMFAIDESGNGEELGDRLASASLIPPDRRTDGAERSSAVVRHTVVEERSLVVEVVAVGEGSFDLSIERTALETSDLTIGGQSRGEVEQAGAASLHRLNSDADQVVTVTVIPTAGTGLDPVIAIFDDGAEIAFADSGGEDAPEVLSATLEAGREYTVSVSGFVDSTGSYEISADRIQVSPITRGTPSEGNIARAGEAVAFEFDGSADDLLRVRVDPSGGLDSVITLLDDQGQEIKFADEGVEAEPETLIASLPDDGQFMIVVSGFEQSTGEFVIVLDKTVATSLSVGETIRGEIVDGTTFDVYRVDVESDGFGAVSVEPAADFDAELLVDTQLGPWPEDAGSAGDVERFKISDLVAEFVAEFDDLDMSSDDISFVLGELFSEPWFFVVSGFEGSSGSYEITLTASES